MSKTRKAGRVKLSTLKRTAKKKIADIKRAEKKVLLKEKKLANQANKLETLGAKLDEQKLKYLALQEEAARAVSDLQWYRQQLSYTELQGTRTSSTS